MTKKRQSKRLTCRKRYKIIKKIHEHHRKLRKLNPGKKKANKKDPGIPNNYPFKEELLKEYIQLDEQKKIDEINYKKEKAARKKMAAEKNSKSNMLIGAKTSATTLDEYVNSARERNDEFSQKENACDEEGRVLKDNSYKRFSKELKKVIEGADIVIEVVDARDPLGTRSPSLEDEVYKSGKNKQLVILLNKIDLVPKEVTKKWLKYLRNEYPTIAFKASTQSQNNRLGQSKASFENVSEGQLSSGTCVGAQTLVKFLKTYKKNPNSDVVGSLTVGIVGLPNVGKSSVINSLKRSKVCHVGAVPGVTKNVQEIKIDSSVRILDSPGVVFPSMERKTLSALTIDVNSINFSNDLDYMVLIENILKCCSEEQLVSQLEIAPYGNDVTKFLANISKRYGKFKKGGIPDAKSAAMVFLNHWKTGKIKYHFLPPDEQFFEPLTNANSSKWKLNFDCSLMMNSEDSDLNAIIKDFSNSLSLKSNAGSGLPMVDKRTHVGVDYSSDPSSKCKFVMS